MAMKVAVVGATGMIGSAVTEELLDRGHHVTGIARNSGKLPAREALTRRSANLMELDSFAEAIRGHDAVVCAFSPGHGIGPQVYKGVVEAGWRIKRAFKRAQGRYLINVGGASSLWNARGTQMFEDPLWPRWYFNTASPEHLRHLHGVTGAAPFEALALSRERIIAAPGADPYADWPEEELRNFVAKIAGNHDIGEGGRAQLELFEHDRSFDWSFVSPPWFLRPGRRTGAYRTTIRELPLDGEVPAGISVADLAVAIADEAERRNFVHAHWSAAST
jgi:putative NADH-flavin reductase